MKPLFAGFLVLLCPTSLTAACLTGSSSQTWKCWQGTINLASSTCSELELYRDAKVKVTFTNGATAITSYAFWDGGTNAMKVRTAFPHAGTWNVTTACDGACPPCLGTRTPSPSSVSVTQTDMEQLYSFGFPQVRVANPNDANSIRYLNLGPGVTPFFWLGDTSWAGPLRSTTSDWTSYLNDRDNDQFSVIQIALPSDWMVLPGAMPKDVLGRDAFLQHCTNNADPRPNNCSKMNPAFWADFDTKVQLANERGLVVMLVGLMERTIQSRYLAGPPAECRPSVNYPRLPDSVTYARNVAARLSGNFVIFSPAFDTVPDVQPNNSNCLPAPITDACNHPATHPPLSCRARCIGETVKKIAPRHLVTYHFGGSTELSGMLWFQDQPWLDFQLFQSGQARVGSNCNTTTQLNSLTQRARSIPQGLWAATPRKPSVNGESIYDANNGRRWLDNVDTVNQKCLATQSEESICLGETNYTPRRARHAGYLSVLGGASGYTFGVKGAWDWGRFANQPVLNLQWPQGAARVSSDQMRHLYTIIQPFSWQLVPNLEGATSIIKNQATAEPQKMVAAWTADREAVLAYLPENESIQLDLAGLNVSTTPQFFGWWDPRTGTWANVAYAKGYLVSGTTYRFCRPCGSPAGCPLDPGVPQRPACPAEPDYVLNLQ